MRILVSASVIRKQGKNKHSTGHCESIERRKQKEKGNAIISNRFKCPITQTAKEQLLKTRCAKHLYDHR